MTTTPPYTTMTEIPSITTTPIKPTITTKTYDPPPTITITTEPSTTTTDPPPPRPPPPPPPTTISSPRPRPTHTASTPTKSTASPTQPVPTSNNNSKNDSSGLSIGGIIGIILTALVALIAALIGIFLIKKRHGRRLNHGRQHTSNTMFNPAHLGMQENRHHHQHSSGAGNGIGIGNGNENNAGRNRNSGLLQALSGRDSFEPLNNHTAPTTSTAVTMLGTSGISALGTQDIRHPYPYDLESHQYVSTVPGGDDHHIRYMPPTDPAYVHYGRYSQHHPEYAATVAVPQQGDDEALCRYYQQPNYQPGDGPRAPVTYYDPRTTGMYYQTAAGRSSEIEAHHQIKNEPWPENRSSTTPGSTFASPHSPKRNPQLVNDSTDIIKVLVSDDSS